MRNSKTFLAVIMSFMLVSGIHAQAVKNVKVLPFETKKEITKYMKNDVAKSLGVKCSFCHNIKDHADDSNPHKLVAREMMQMLSEVNVNMTAITEVAKEGGVDGWVEPPVVECWSCHRGETKPEYARPTSP